MAKKHRAAELLKENYSIPEIAAELSISISTVVQYLYSQVVEGAIKRSDILFSISAEERQAMENAIQQAGTDTDFYAVGKALSAADHRMSQEMIRIYLNLRSSRVSMGDMYELISEIETTLHDFVKKELINEFGSGEDGWWRQGIPSKIRALCAASREEDPEPAEEPYCYTNFIHLQEIIDKHWAIFSRILPSDIVKEKRRFLNGLGRLNHIRNSIMHPVKRIPVTEDDFVFVRQYRALIGIMVLSYTEGDSG